VDLAALGHREHRSRNEEIEALCGFAVNFAVFSYLSSLDFWGNPTALFTDAHDVSRHASVTISRPSAVSDLSPSEIEAVQPDLVAHSRDARAT
jgi:hypothetical protein